jgi:hypothetical protein
MGIFDDGYEQALIDAGKLPPARGGGATHEFLQTRYRFYELFNDSGASGTACTGKHADSSGPQLTIRDYMMGGF